MNFGFIDKLYNIALVVLIILLIAAAFCIVFVFLSKRNRSRKITEDLVDYSQLDRYDSADYLKLEDIRDKMVITDNGNRFIAVIKAQGYDFYSAPEAEQGATAAGFMAFVGTIDKPMTYRQSSKIMDTEDMRNMYSDSLAKVQEKLFHAIEDRRDIVVAMKQNADMTEDEVRTYESELGELQNKIDALQWREFHIQDQIAYIDHYSGDGVMPDEEETWIVEWEYDPMNFARDLTKEEIYQRAQQELEAICSAKIHGLSNSGVKGKRCSTEELIEMNRRYSAPISAGRYKLKDILNSTFFEDINTSTDAQEMMQKVANANTDDMVGAMADMLVGDMMTDIERPVENSIKNVVSEKELTKSCSEETGTGEVKKKAVAKRNRPKDRVRFDKKEETYENKGTDS